MLKCTEDVLRVIAAVLDISVNGGCSIITCYPGNFANFLGNVVHVLHSMASQVSRRNQFKVEGASYRAHLVILTC